MKPYLSIVIPYYNSADTIGPLLTSIARSVRAPSYEVVVVDDGSKIKLKTQISKIKNSVQNGKLRNIWKNIHIHELKSNMGPAAARNRGAKAARGRFLVFLDSDVELFPDTLHNLARVYLKDPDVVAQTGVWAKEQKTGAFFPNFKALRDWSYWINERDKSGYYYLFSTRIASIKKTVFTRLGGFDERYPGALVEDIELTYRIARRYAIIFSPEVRVKHEFESFWPIAKKYFLRAYYWTKLYARRKKFDPVATTWWEALTAVSGTGAVILGLISLVSLPALPLIVKAGNSVPEIYVRLSLVSYELFAAILMLHAFMVRKFTVFMYREKGLAFALKGFLVGLVLYCFIFSGALWGQISNKIAAETSAK